MLLATKTALIVMTGASLLSAILYWRDKRAAQSEAWRVSEKTLHLLSLAGGWPGAWWAQKQFRHKTVKQPFRTIFKMTIILNIGLIVWMHSQSGEAQLRHVLGSFPATFLPSNSSMSIEWSGK